MAGPSLPAIAAQGRPYNFFSFFSSGRRRIRTLIDSPPPKEFVDIFVVVVVELLSGLKKMGVKLRIGGTGEEPSQDWWAAERYV
jgi:hypothetical protein